MIQTSPSKPIGWLTKNGWMFSFNEPCGFCKLALRHDKDEIQQNVLSFPQLSKDVNIWKETVVNVKLGRR